MPKAGREVGLVEWIAKYIAADVSIISSNTTTSLKSNISPTMQPFEDLNSRGCCPRRVDEVGPRDSELNWWLSRNNGRGVAIVSIIIKCSDLSQIDASREVEIDVRSSLLTSRYTKSCSDLASQAPYCIHALL